MTRDKTESTSETARERAEEAYVVAKATCRNGLYTPGLLESSVGIVGGDGMSEDHIHQVAARRALGAAWSVAVSAACGHGAEYGQVMSLCAQLTEYAIGRSAMNALGMPWGVPGPEMARAHLEWASAPDAVEARALAVSYVLAVLESLPARLDPWRMRQELANYLTTLQRGLPAIRRTYRR